MFKKIHLVIIVLLFGQGLYAQEFQKNADSYTFSNPQVKITVNSTTGKVNYLFTSGVKLDNTVAYVRDINSGYLSTADLTNHTYTLSNIADSIGKGTRLAVKHADAKHNIILTQNFTIYKQHPYVLVSLTAENKNAQDKPLETRDISPIAILPQYQGKAFVPGTEPRIMDMPFDNDDWTPIVERNWPATNAAKTQGISYEFIALYDLEKMNGLAIGSVQHDFWKTGLAYGTGTQLGELDSLRIFGGAATADNPSLKSAYGGLDGTHDHTVHGTMTGHTLNSPLLYLCALPNINQTLTFYGQVNAAVNGSKKWKGNAPVYWNSFGVEGVLGYEGVMMPPAVEKISDFIKSMPNFSAYSKPVMSIDSYDQGIYSTEVLADLGKYAQKNGQQMGFYFIPFAMWNWKDDINNKKVPGSNYALKDVLLHDKDGQPIMYKEGKWGAYAMDPTHPAIRLYIIQQLKKAKAINAKFLKIDFLTAGSLETTRRYDPKVRTGMQAYNYGMKLLDHLVDSLLGKDIFITQAISPMFPSQYAHTRFVSTDVYSHLRDDQPGFPNWGSTESSLAYGSHMSWVQGTLYPFTNMDVAIMKNFQKNPDLNEQEIKVRIYAMMVMGSILGDGSDFRNPLAALRAQKFLDNKQVAAYFSNPKAFIPIKFADGETFDQQLSFYLPGDTTMLALFNFDRNKEFKQTFTREALHLDLHKKYIVKDFLSDEVLGELKADAPELTISTAHEDAVLVKLTPVKE